MAIPHLALRKRGKRMVRRPLRVCGAPILNKALRQTVPDNIVGEQTIAALDAQVGRKKAPAPPVAPQVRPDATEQRLVAKEPSKRNSLTGRQRIFRPIQAL